MGLRESLQDNISIDKKFLNIFPATNSFMLQFWEILVFVWWVSGFNPSCKGGEELCSEECAGYSHLQLHLIKWGWNINYIHILYLPRNTSRNLKNCKNILIKHHLNRGENINYIYWRYTYYFWNNDTIRINPNIFELRSLSGSKSLDDMD